MKTNNKSMRRAYKLLDENGIGSRKVVEKL